MQNIRLAFRTLFRTPFVTTIAVLSLALGIGANAAIYSLFDQVLLRPLPVRDPGRLVNLGAPGPKPGFGNCGTIGDCDGTFSYPMFRDLERHQKVFAGMAALQVLDVSLDYQSEPATGVAMMVSGSYFPTLGVRPAIGRLLTESDTRSNGTSFVAVLSYAYWQSRLGGRDDVLGTPLLVNGKTMTIVGVAARGFEGTTLGTKPLVYVPISMAELLAPDAFGLDLRTDYWVYVFARLNPAVSVQQASVGINALYHSIINDVEVPLQKGMSDSTLVRFRAKQVTIEPGPQGQSLLPKNVRAPLLMLFGVTGIVLLIACANIANLLLARGAARSMEMGVRLALGASRRRLVGQLLLEALLLAVLGGAASLLVAKWTLAGVASLLPASASGGLTFTLQPTVLVFSSALALATGVAFGMFPAWHNTRGELASTIRANASHISGARAATRFRATLVTVQISLATSLLIAAGLFVKSLVHVTRVDLGVHVDSIVEFSVSPERSGYDSPRALAYYQRVEDALAGIPGVTKVTASNVPMLAGTNRSRGIKVQGFPTGPDIDNNSHLNLVGTDYFSTFGVHLIAGREFTRADRLGAPRVAVVNQAFVKKFNLGRGAIGTFMSSSGTDSMNIQIVGIVPDVKYSEVKQPVPPVFYLPWRQFSQVRSMTYYIRTPHPDVVLRNLAGEVRAVDPSVPLENPKTLAQQVEENTFLDRMISILSTSFAVLATLLAAVGLYGVLAYSVALRTREIGVRMALGADAGSVRTMVLGHVLRLIAVGAALGLAGAVALGQAASSLLFGLKGTDPVVFALSLVVLLLVALAAGWLPARRASRVDPIKALRYE